MKKLILAISVITLIASCERSKKGHWTKSDKEQAKKDFKSGMKTSPIYSMLSEKQANDFCDCVIDKLEQKYESPKSLDKNSMNTKEMENLGMECAGTIIK